MNVRELFDNYGKERSTFSSQDVEEWKKSFSKELRENLGQLNDSANERLDDSSMRLLQSLWFPELNWVVMPRPELVKIERNGTSLSFYGTAVKLYLRLDTTFEQVLTQFNEAAKIVSENQSMRLIKCSENSFFREFHEKVFQYIDDKEKQKIIRFMEDKTSLEYLDYSDDLFEQGFFDKHQSNIGKPITTMMALRNKRSGDVVYKGDYVEPIID